MGNFSWLCKRCGGAINSEHHHGHECALLFYHKGQLIEYMTGQYDGYGAIYDPREKASIEWTNDWQLMNDAMSGADESSGMVVYHRRCAPKFFLTKNPGNSEHDPNQGWGRFKQVEHDISYISHVVLEHPFTPEIAKAKRKAQTYAECMTALENLTRTLTIQARAHGGREELGGAFSQDILLYWSETEKKWLWRMAGDLTSTCQSTKEGGP